MQKNARSRAFFAAYAAVLGVLSLGCAGAQSMVEDTVKTVENITSYTHSAEPEAVEAVLAQMLVNRNMSIARQGPEVPGQTQRLLVTEVRGGNPTLDIMHSKLPLPVIKITDKIHYEARVVSAGQGRAQVEVLRIVNGRPERDITLEWLLIEHFDPDSAAAIMSTDSMFKMPMDVCKLQMRLGAYSTLEECLADLQ